MLRALWALVPACTFATELPIEEAPGLDPGSSQPVPATRCQAAGLVLCVDFEDMPNPTDGIAPAANLVSMNVMPQERFVDENAAEFERMSQLKVDEMPKLDIATNLTIEMWTNPSERPKDDQQFGLFDNHLQYAMSLEEEGEVECSINGTSADADVSLASNAWHHVACTYDGTQLRVYVDGELRGCESITTTISSAGLLGSAIGANMDVGPMRYRNKFLGQLDNVHVYNSTLSAADICTLWGNGDCDDTCPTGNSGNGSQGGWDD